MNRIQIKYLLFLLLGAHIACSFTTPPENIIQHNNSKNSTSIADNVFLLAGVPADLTVHEILQQPFSRHSGGQLNLGLVKESVWVQFSIRNNTKDDELYLKAAQPVIDSVELYLINGDGVTAEYRAGEYNKFWKRPVNSPNYIFPVRITPDSVQTFVMRLRSTDPIQLPLFIGSGRTIMEEEQTQGILFGIYAGIIMIMILYNTFLSVSVRDRSYIYYVFYVLFVGLTQAVLKGYAFQYLWPSSPLTAMQSTIIIPTLSGITTGLFMKSFLELRKVAPKFNVGVTVFIGTYVIAGMTGLFYDRQLGVLLLQIIAFTGSLFALSVGGWLMYKGLRIAIFFVIAYSVFLVAVILFVLTNFNVLPYNNFTAYILEIGSVLQIMLLSLALADKINTYRKERSVARIDALRASMENERLVKEQNIILEEQVKLRTAELSETNENLNQTLSQLKATQTKLVDSEKMASLGQLTAGIAHEINNPINFVAANVRPLELDINDIMDVLNRYENIDLSGDVEAQLQAIDAHKKNIDIDYVEGEIQSLLTGIRDGASRTAEIVLNLKNFVRVDQSNFKLVNLNEGLESTLILIRNTFPQNLVLQKHLGKLEPVECMPGKINQVFMNIINNAIQATKARVYNNGELPTLVISSWQDGALVKISIKDNGIGMTDEVLNKIYEPFFTTKDVGEGTGLGMSIVKGIIDSHNGSLEVQSTPGVGTEFVLTLPIRSTIE